MSVARITYDPHRLTVAMVDQNGKTIVAFAGVTNPDAFAHLLADKLETQTTPLVRRVVVDTIGEAT